MLLFVDESGHHKSGTPCEVLAGVAIAEDVLWNLVRAIRSAEKERFGDYLRNLLGNETKGRKLLKTKRFRLASRTVEIPEADLSSHWPTAFFSKAKRPERKGPTTALPPASK